MLVLSRKSREQITIGQDIVITVLSVSGNTVRIGIEAPENVPVMRTEIVNRRPKSAEARGALEPSEAAEGAAAGRKGLRRVPRFVVAQPRDAERLEERDDSAAGAEATRVQTRRADIDTRRAEDTVTPRGVELTGRSGAALGSMMERVRAVRLSGSAC